MLKFDA